jgi:hypothetical protein
MLAFLRFLSLLNSGNRFKPVTAVNNTGWFTLTYKDYMY